MTIELYGFLGLLSTLGVIWVFERNQLRAYWRGDLKESEDYPMLRAYFLIFLLYYWPLVVIYSVYRYFRMIHRSKASTDAT